MTELTAIHYAIDASAIAGQWVARSIYDYHRTITKLKDAIAARDLWLIAEIDSRMLLARVGLAIQPTRQLLFFHPRYMQRLLQADARALQEAPLKIVVMTDASGHVVMRGPDMRVAFDRYAGARLLGEELSVLCGEIIAAVASPEDP